MTFLALAISRGSWPAALVRQRRVDRNAIGCIDVAAVRILNAPDVSHVMIVPPVQRPCGLGISSCRLPDAAAYFTFSEARSGA
jgi:hypothetical protein